MGKMVEGIVSEIDLGNEIKNSYIEALLEDKDVKEKYTLIHEVLKTLKKKRIYLNQQKNLYEKSGNNVQKEIVKNKIKEIKRVKKILNEQLQSLIFPIEEEKVEKEKIPVYLRMQISNLNDIKSMEYLFDGDTKTVLEEIEKENETTKKLELIEQLIIKFEDMLKTFNSKLDNVIENLILEAKKNGDYKLKIKRKNIKNLLSDQKYESFKLNIEYYNISIKGIKTILERLYTLKGLQKAIISKKEKIEERKNFDIFDDNKINIINTIFDNSNLDNEQKQKAKSVSKLFFNSLELDEIDFSLLSDCSQFLISIFDKMEKEDVICLSNIFRNSLKNKCFNLKNEKMETSSIKKTLKGLMKKFNERKKMLFEEKQEKENESYVDIFKVLLNDELNYYYFNRILEEVKFDLNSLELKLILESITDKFVYNYKFKIASQNFHYIDPKYYESLIDLFIQHGLLNDELKDIIMSMLENFRNSLFNKEGHISQGKAEALKDIDNLVSRINGYVDCKSDYSYLVDKIKFIMKEKISYIVNNPNNLGFNSGDKEKYKDYNYSTFVYGKYAYSKRYNDEGDFFFQVHILDTSSIITENECLDDDIKEASLSGKNIPFKYELGNKYPVMTFQFRIYKNNSVGDMKVFSNVIEIDNVYELEELINYRENVDLKALISAHKRIGSFSLDCLDVDKNTDYLLSSHIIEFLNGFEKEVPMMYRRSSGQIFEDLNIQNHNQVCYYLSKIPKKKAHNIFHILDEMPEDIYTNYQTDDAYLLIDPFSYSGLYLLRVIKQLIKGEYCFSEEEYNREKDKIISYCKTLNSNYGYVPEKIMKNDKIKRY